MKYIILLEKYVKLISAEIRGKLSPWNFLTVHDNTKKKYPPKTRSQYFIDVLDADFLLFNSSIGVWLKDVAISLLG